MRPRHQSFLKFPEGISKYLISCLHPWYWTAVQGPETPAGRLLEMWVLGATMYRLKVHFITRSHSSIPHHPHRALDIPERGGGRGKQLKNSQLAPLS